MAYATWLGQRDGATYRLPTEAEWELAARGADGRAFPWGNKFDATFCKMRESRPGFCQVEPIGAFALDESPFGARDLAGGLRAWVGDIVGELSAEQAMAIPEPPAGTPRDGAGMRLVRGGGWSLGAQFCRAASRNRVFSMSRLGSIGIRLVRTLRRG
jgi:eukaryotic-like serine/threonine-protein kinase